MVEGVAPLLAHSFLIEGQQYASAKGQTPPREQGHHFFRQAANPGPRSSSEKAANRSEGKKVEEGDKGKPPCHGGRLKDPPVGLCVLLQSLHYLLCQDG